MKYFFLILTALAAQCCIVPAFAQKASFSTNVVGYANLGTVNAEASYAVDQHFTMNAGMKYNPFEYEKEGEAYSMRNKQMSFALGARYWPWHIYSGWWMAAKAQYQLYNSGGMRSPETREGNRYGAGLSLGYTYMLGTHFNIELGAGVWAGLDDYTLYSCPECGLTLDDGQKFFVIPNDIIIALSYVF